MKGYLLSLFALIAMVVMIIASGAFTSVLLERNVSLTLADDTYGMVALSPGPEGHDYFHDSDGDGTFELHIADAPMGQETQYVSLFTITNNLNRTISVSISDEGEYNDSVTFSSGSDNLESGQKTIAIGNSIDVTVTVDAPSSAGTTSLLSQLVVQVYEASAEPLIILTRDAEVVAVDAGTPGAYDPTQHTMPENAEFVRATAHGVLEDGGTIRTWGSHRYTDMGLEPNVWQMHINGYTYKYNELAIRTSEKEPVIQVSPLSDDITVKTVSDGVIYTIYRRQSICLSVYGGVWYAKVGSKYEEVTLWEYY